MISVSGTWYDGQTSAGIAAVCHVYDNGAVSVQRHADGRPLLTLARFLLTASPRLADTHRFVYFPDGQSLETADDDTVDRLFAAHKRLSMLDFVYRLESQWRYVLLALAVLLASAIGGMTYGIPYLAEKIAFRLPPTVLNAASAQTLAIMDRSWLQPSELTADRQRRLTVHFQTIIDAHPAQNISVLFRKSPQAGPNAFALPDGTVIFTDAMVHLAERNDELLAVLAHEIGHVVYRHGMRKLIQDSILGFALLAITGDVSGSSELFLGLPVVLTQLAYSRTFEREADRYALAYLRAHHIPPRRFADMMRKIAHAMEQNGRAEKWSGYLSTHPLTQERIAEFDSDLDPE